MKKTVLVLGAGASVDLGYPLGKDLFDQLVLDLDSTISPRNEGQYLSDGLNQYLKSQFSEGDLDRKTVVEVADRLSLFITEYRSKAEKTQSIDAAVESFVQSHENMGEKVKKLVSFLIAYRLFGYEARSLQYGRFNPDLHEGEIYWANNLWKHLLRSGWEGTSDNIRIISFNYERAIEFALFQNLWNQNVNFSPKEELFHGQLFMKRNITRVYGSLGHFLPPYYPYSTSTTEDKGGFLTNPAFVKNALPFGLPNDRNDAISEVSPSIRLISKERNDREELDYQKHFHWAEQIFFLGFGFDQDNMRILGWENFAENGLKGRLVMSTGGVPHGHVPTGIKFTNLYCSKFTSSILLNCL